MSAARPSNIPAPFAADPADTQAWALAAAIERDADGDEQAWALALGIDSAPVN